MSAFAYSPNEYETERASNIYLMSLVVVLVGLPLPILNFIATVIVYFSNANNTYFVRWHSLQALLSQALIAVANSFGMYWTLSILFGDYRFTNEYAGYLGTIIIFNALEFVSTIYAAIRTRKGDHVEFWFFGPLTDLLCKK